MSTISKYQHIRSQELWINGGTQTFKFEDDEETNSNTKDLYKYLILWENLSFQNYHLKSNFPSEKQNMVLHITDTYFSFLYFR